MAAAWGWEPMVPLGRSARYSLRARGMDVPSRNQQIRCDKLRTRKLARRDAPGVALGFRASSLSRELEKLGLSDLYIRGGMVLKFKIGE
jgi:hypothetical protein